MTAPNTPQELPELPVVAWHIKTRHGSAVKEWVPEELRSIWKPLTDLATARTEIDKRDQEIARLKAELNQTKPVRKEQRRLYPSDPDYIASIDG